MSMKRSKAKSSGTARDTGTDDATYFKKTKAPELTYEQHMDGKTDDLFAPFSMNATYAKGALITHAKFGKGVVVAVEGLRVEVLFADGMKKLSHMMPA
jgi:hypothetical protein